MKKENQFLSRSRYSFGSDDLQYLINNLYVIFNNNNNNNNNLYVEICLGYAFQWTIYSCEKAV